MVTDEYLSVAEPARLGIPERRFREWMTAVLAKALPALLLRTTGVRYNVLTHQVRAVYGKL